MIKTNGHHIYEFQIFSNDISFTQALLSYHKVQYVTGVSAHESQKLLHVTLIIE